MTRPKKKTILKKTASSSNPRNIKSFYPRTPTKPLKLIPETRTYFPVTFQELTQLIKREYGVQVNLPYVMGWENDEDYNYILDVTGKKQSEQDIKIIEKVRIAANDPDLDDLQEFYMESAEVIDALLRDLAFRKILPSGEYSIHVSW